MGEAREIHFRHNLILRGQTSGKKPKLKGGERVIWDLSIRGPKGRTHDHLRDLYTLFFPLTINVKRDEQPFTRYSGQDS